MEARDKQYGYCNQEKEVLHKLYNLIHLLGHIPEFDGDEAAIVDVDVFVVLDAAEGAGGAGQWALEDADLAADVAEGFAVGDQGDFDLGLADGVDETGHLFIADDQNAVDGTSFHGGHLGAKLLVGDIGDEAKVTTQGTCVLQLGQIGLGGVDEDEVAQFGSLYDSMAFGTRDDLFVDRQKILDAVFFEGFSDLQDVFFVSDAHGEPMTIVFGSAISMDVARVFGWIRIRVARGSVRHVGCVFLVKGSLLSIVGGLRS